MQFTADMPFHNAVDVQSEEGISPRLKPIGGQVSPSAELLKYPTDAVLCCAHPFSSYLRLVCDYASAMVLRRSSQ